jgi:hypothetical protein
MPIAAAYHIDAAVAKLFILSSALLLRITPAPRKPIPVTSPAAILDGSTWGEFG